jgi:hypothetical protein
MCNRLSFKCSVCNDPLPVRTPEQATYVVDGEVVCGYTCYLARIVDHDVEWDLPPAQLPRSSVYYAEAQAAP